MPIFLVPYKVVLGFNKETVNKYVRFSFLHWDDKHPIGELIECIGDVNNISAYYQYSQKVFGITIFTDRWPSTQASSMDGPASPNLG